MNLTTQEATVLANAANLAPGSPGGYTATSVQTLYAAGPSSELLALIRLWYLYVKAHGADEGNND